MAESLYGLAVNLDVSRRSQHPPKRLSCPVISIGNLTVGGVGKTPVVEAVVKEALALGRCPGILSRGYGARRGQHNDEHALLVRRLEGVPHEQGPDRHAVGSALLSRRPDIDLLVLDDGLQHRRLHRDLDVIVLDATRPLGFGRLLPRGMLRESVSGLARAGVFVVTRGEDASAHKLAVLETLLRDFFPGRPVIQARHVVEGVRSLDGREGPLPESGRVGIFAGIGNPNAFSRTVERLGLQVVGARTFKDHHEYSVGDLTELVAWGKTLGVNRLLTTEKDGVKLERWSAALETADLEIQQIRMRFDLDGDILAALPDLTA